MPEAQNAVLTVPSTPPATAAPTIETCPACRSTACGQFWMPGHEGEIVGQRCLHCQNLSYNTFPGTIERADFGWEYVPKEEDE